MNNISTLVRLVIYLFTGQESGLKFSTLAWQHLPGCNTQVLRVISCYYDKASKWASYALYKPLVNRRFYTRLTIVKYLTPLFVES